MKIGTWVRIMCAYLLCYLPLPVKLKARLVYIPDDKLNQFYLNYVQWLDSDDIRNDHRFSPSAGLCSNVAWNNNSNGYDAKSQALLQVQLDAAFHNDAYPFNVGIGFARENNYGQESKEHIAYLNPRRQAWVRAMADIIEKKDSTK